MISSSQAHSKVWPEATGPRPTLPHSALAVQGALPVLFSRGLTLAVRLLVLAAVPASILWYPVYERAGTGAVSIADVMMACLWIIAVPAHLVSVYAGEEQRRAFLIHLTAIAPGVLAALASVAWLGAEGGSSEILIHAKRFGLASVIPLAMAMCRSKRLLCWSQRLICGCIALLAVSTVVPQIADAMPARDRVEAHVVSDRAVGLITNPNDLAYLMVCGVVIVLAIHSSERRAFGLRSASVLLAVIAAGYCLAGTGSRSGVFGVAAAGTFFTLKGGGTLRHRIAVVLLLSGAALGAVQFNEVFQQRMQTAYSEGASEINLMGRLDAQQMAVEASLLNPFGVGYHNFAAVTKQHSRGLVGEVEGSDSVYVDTLLGAGFFGLASLLACFTLCYQHLRPSCPADRRPMTILRSGAVAVFVFGLASVSPISVFVSPMFFFMIGLGGMIRQHGPASSRNLA